MAAIGTAIRPPKTQRPQAAGSGPLDAIERLASAFRQSFALFDAASGEAHHRPSDWLNVDLTTRIGLLEEIHRRGKPEIIEDYAPLILLAVPLALEEHGPHSYVALTTLVTQNVKTVNDIAPAAHVLGVDAANAYRWALGRDVWPPHAAEELAKALSRNFVAEANEHVLRDQVSSVSHHLLQALEELSLLHRLTEQLSLSRTGADLAQMAVEWLARVIPARAIVACLADDADLPEGTRPGIITCGDLPISADEFPRFIERLGPDVDRDCLLLDRRALQSPTWYYRDIEQLICVPIRTADERLGYLLALGHAPSAFPEDADFGVIESSLLASVASILAVHLGNLKLYHEQSDFFASVVKVLSSTIDAKDPYTRGHSERVARIAQRIAREMGASEQDLNTLYFGGLMHDIGKIGLDDAVLRKPGQLTSEEFELVKRHPDLGCEILAGVKQLEHLLPVVRHHHEAWNGKGYPQGLAGDACPRLARITAVADAYDAMSSDRPYRKGLPHEKVTEILASGAGEQWDPEVVATLLAIRGDIVDLVRRTNAELQSIDLPMPVI